MAVLLEFINVIVPLRLIRDRYPGGWEQFLTDNDSIMGRRAWHDDYLFRDGAMSPGDAEAIVQQWGGLGFIGIAEQEGAQYWADLCVYEAVLRRGPTLPCGWIALTDDRRAAFLAGTEPGKIIGRWR